MDEQSPQLALCTDIVSAYVSNNKISSTDFPSLIQSVYQSLGLVGKPVVEAQEPVVKATASQIRKSIGESGLISFEDGKTYQSLKRTLAKLGMAPDDYRAKWGLPKDYPMVAPAYAAKRSELAKSIGLGRRIGAKVTAAAPKAKKGAKAKAE
jgi:predicted transcriptional regulator